MGEISVPRLLMKRLPGGCFISVPRIDVAPKYDKLTNGRTGNQI